jgi:hypothetical protein
MFSPSYPYHLDHESKSNFSYHHHHDKAYTFSEKLDVDLSVTTKKSQKHWHKKHRSFVFYFLTIIEDLLTNNNNHRKLERLSEKTKHVWLFREGDRNLMIIKFNYYWRLQLISLLVKIKYKIIVWLIKWIDVNL